jgi:hypothetical protein
MPVSPEAVWERLESAEIRGAELVALNGGELGGADPKVRQRLVQEFFFHLGGAIEVMAQLAGEQRGVGSSDTISISNIADQLKGDPLEGPLRDLYVSLRRAPFPANPYNDEGLVWRAYNYRHQVTHRGANPFLFHLRLGDAGVSSASSAGQENPSAHFLLDPLNPERGPSRETVRDDHAAMLALVRRRLTTAMNAV